MSLLIANPEEKHAIIDRFLRDPATTGGRDRLWNHIRKVYSNISRREVASHLANDATHQIHRPLPRRVTTRAIVTDGRSKVAQIDLIDMSAYAGFKGNKRTHYCLTYVDTFSKFCACQPLPNKTAKAVCKGMEAILDSMPESWRPKTIQADNGGEFQTLLNDMLNKRGIKLIHSSAYNPTSNSHVERFNRTLKSSVFEYMTRHNTKVYVPILPSLITNFNNTIHGTTKLTPLQIMQADETPKMIEEIQERIRKRVKQNSVVSKMPALKEGDFVRVANNTEAAIRRQTFRKKIGANWSTTVFQIYKISEPVNYGIQQQFLLKNMDTGVKSRKRYWAYQLLPTTYDPTAPRNIEEEKEGVAEEEPKREEIVRAPEPSEPKKQTSSTAIGRCVGIPRLGEGQLEI